jgi:hypothetical protein
VTTAHTMTSRRTAHRRTAPHTNGSHVRRGNQNPVRFALDQLKKALADAIFVDAGVTAEDIFITLFAKKNLTYIPSEYHVPAGENTVVTWDSFDGPFTITALGSSPFDGVRFQSEPLTTGGGFQVKATVRDDAPQGTYRYAIALIGGDGKVYVDPSCPPIIVE